MLSIVCPALISWTFICSNTEIESRNIKVFNLKVSDLTTGLWLSAFIFEYKHCQFMAIQIMINLISLIHALAGTKHRPLNPCPLILNSKRKRDYNSFRPHDTEIIILLKRTNKSETAMVKSYKLFNVSSFFISLKFLHKYLPLAISTNTQNPFWIIWKENPITNNYQDWYQEKEKKRILDWT